MKESRIVFAYKPNKWHAGISMLVLLQARPYRGMVDEEYHIDKQ